MPIATQDFEDVESINDLNDVDISNRADGRILEYNSASGNMEYVDPPSGGGGGTASEVVFWGQAADTGQIGVSAFSTISWTTGIAATGVTNVSGEITVPAAFNGRVAKILFSVEGSGAGDRAQIQCQLAVDPDGASGYTVEGSAANYAARNGTQSQGGVSGFCYVTLATGMKIRLQAGIVGNNMNKVVTGTALAIEAL